MRTQIAVQFTEKRAHLGGLSVSSHDKSAIGKPLMGIQHAADNICRQHRVEPVFEVEHERVVAETVAVVVHVIATEQESTVLRAVYEVVPLRLPIA